MGKLAAILFLVLAVFLFACGGESETVGEPAPKATPEVFYTGIACFMGGRQN